MEQRVTAGELMLTRSWLQGRNGQPLVERLMLAEAHGEVDRHFGRLAVTPNGIEDSEEEEVV